MALQISAAPKPSKRSKLLSPSCGASLPSIQIELFSMETVVVPLHRPWSPPRFLICEQSFYPAASTILKSLITRVQTVCGGLSRKRRAYRERPFWLALHCIMRPKFGLRRCCCMESMTTVLLLPKPNSSQKLCPTPESWRRFTSLSVDIKFQGTTCRELSGPSCKGCSIPS